MELNSKKNLTKLTMELLWWVITIIVIVLTIQPIWPNFAVKDFLYELVLFQLIFITYTRYLFALKNTFLADAQKLKVLLIFLSLPLAFYLIQMFFNYQDFLDKQNEGMQEFDQFFVEGISFDTHNNTIQYLTKVYLFFGLSAIISVIVSPFRLLLSYWRVFNNTGTV